MRDKNREHAPSVVGQVPMAINQKPTTWEDLKALGVDPWTDPNWPDKYTSVVTVGMMGVPQRAIARE